VIAPLDSESGFSCSCANRGCPKRGQPLIT